MTLDPVTLAVLGHRCAQIADEMDATLFRSAFNPIIAEAHDASHGLYDAITGDAVRAGDGLVVMIWSRGDAVRTPEDIAAGSGLGNYHSAKNNFVHNPTHEMLDAYLVAEQRMDG